MKKISIIFMSILLVLSLAACGGNPSSQNDGSVSTSDPGSGTADMSSSEPEATEPERGKTLVVYYSATGNTERVAGYIAAAANADTFELVPVNAYAEADLNWRDESSRVVYEYEHPEERDVALVTTEIPDWASYDTVFIGYPIWWGIAAWPVDGFIAANDFTGKTVIPFCTSSSSGLGESGTLLEEAAGTGTWLEGRRFSSGASENDVRAWVEGLNL